MLNLLPPQQKNNLLKEENWKSTLILIIFSLFFFIVLFLVLLLINIFILSDLDVQEITLSRQEESQNDLQIQSLKEELADFNQTILNLDDFYQTQPDLTGIIEKISELLPPDLYLTDLDFVAFPAEQKEFSGQFSLAGFAFQREALLEFKENLEGAKEFGEINFPSLNWVKPNNINFAVNFKIK